MQVVRGWHEDVASTISSLAAWTCPPDDSTCRQSLEARPEKSKWFLSGAVTSRFPEAEVKWHASGIQVPIISLAYPYVSCKRIFSKRAGRICYLLTPDCGLFFMNQAPPRRGRRPRTASTGGSTGGWQCLDTQSQVMRYPSLSDDPFVYTPPHGAAPRSSCKRIKFHSSNDSPSLDC